jgi:hypothetical protein
MKQGLIIAIELEERPAVASACLDADEELALWDWIQSVPELNEFVQRAIELADPDMEYLDNDL